MAEVALAELAIVISAHCINQMEIGIAFVLSNNYGVIVWTWYAKHPNVVFDIGKYHLRITHVILCSITQLSIIIVATCVKVALLRNIRYALAAIGRWDILYLNILFGSLLVIFSMDKILNLLRNGNRFLVLMAKLATSIKPNSINFSLSRKNRNMLISSTDTLNLESIKEWNMSRAVFLLSVTKSKLSVRILAKSKNQWIASEHHIFLHLFKIQINLQLIKRRINR